MKKKNDSPEKLRLDLSRRGFLGGGAAAAATAAIWTTACGSIQSPAVVPRHVLGGPGHTPPSGKINIAGIGVGGRGGNDIKEVSGENIVALCDVDEKKAAGIFRKYPDAKRYRDYREMLETQEDIDAVVIGTPDHTHAVISMAAMKKGKHVYCEKPLTHSVAESRMLTEAAREAGVATQMGNQGISGEETRLLCEWVWDGAIGPVREVHVWTNRPIWPQGIDRPKETPPVPATLDWDLWIGPAPYRPYHPTYHPFSWRGWWDFGTGALGDIACHRFAPIFRALKLGHPTSVEACHSSLFTRKKGRVTDSYKESFPRAAIVRYRFPARGQMPPLELNWYDGGMKPPRPEELEAGRNLRDQGVLLVGDGGKMLDSRLIPESKMKAYKRPPKSLPRSAGHHLDWVNACKGGKPGDSNFDIAGPLAEAVLLGNIAMRTDKTLLWDGPKLKITNAPEMNQFLEREYREGWRL